MIKKIGIFLGAIFIALVGIFSVNPLKNTAETQYFNKTIQNKFIENSINNFSFYLDNNLNYYQDQFSFDDFLENDSFETSDIIFYSLNNEIISIKEFANSYEMNLEFGPISFASRIDNTGQLNEFTVGNIKIYKADWTDNIWTYSTIEEGSLGYINRFDLINWFLNGYTVENVNNELTKFIGNLTSLPTPQETPLDKIGSIINGIIDWFITIFNGLGDIFVVYENGSITGLSTWGTIVFIPLAIGLVITVLRWVIRLVRGI